jgi:Flp pilus assembly protein TadG
MLRRALQFARAKDGLAAVEFALIAPVMIIMFFGVIELSSAVDCNARVSRVTSTVGDLVAQATTVSTTDTTNAFSAANAILYPYAAANARIVVSSLVDDGKGTTKVAWSDAQNASPRTVASTVTVPAGLVTSGSGSSVIFVEISYTFTPAVAYFLGGSVALTDTFYAKPRRSLTVKHS